MSKHRTGRIFLNIGDSRAACAICEKRLKDGDVVMRIMVDSFFNHSTYRYHHLFCLLDEAGVPERVHGSIRRAVKRQALLEAV
jgi:hypothetical protein